MAGAITEYPWEECPKVRDATRDAVISNKDIAGSFAVELKSLEVGVANAFMEAVEGNRSVNSLYISYTHCSLPRDAFSRISRSIAAQDCSITALHIKSNANQTERACKWSRTLPKEFYSDVVKCAQLSSLKLERIEIDAGFAVHPELKSLRLVDCVLTAQIIYDIISSLSCTLQTLTISGCHVTPHGGFRLSELVPDLCTIQRIDFHGMIDKLHTRLSEDLGTFIYELVEVSSDLQFLDMRDMPFTATDAVEISRLNVEDCEILISVSKRQKYMHSCT